MMLREVILALFCLPALAQTRVEPQQIRDWRQVAPLVGTRPGTQVAVQQLRIDPSWIASWRETTNVRGPGRFQVALPMSQDNPVLITCWHVWQKCELNPYKPWFETRWDGALVTH